MIIGIDARWIFRELSGIGMVTRELIRELPRLAPDDRFIFYFHDPIIRDRTLDETGVERLPNIRGVLLKRDIFDPIGQLTMPRQLRRDGIDLYHSTNYMLPLPAFSPRLNRRPVCVLTIHDMIPLLAPQETPHALKTRLLPIFRCLLNAAVRRADAILTPSDASRSDLLRALKIPAARHSRVVRVYNGVSPIFRPGPAAADCSSPESDDAARPRRLLYVGRADPYKNLPALVEAFAAARRLAPWPLQLTILGAPDTRYPEADLRAAALGLGPDAVRWTGYCDDQATLAAYREADLLVHPARHEGFGLPVVEAMAAGLPVLANDIPVLREIAGDAAVFADAGAPELFARAMLGLLQDRARLAVLRSAGMLRAARYTWRRAAEETLAVYRAAAARLEGTRSQKSEVRSQNILPTALCPLPTDLRVVLGHDWLTGMRGGERVLELAASRYPAAPILTLLCNRRAISPALNAHPIITSPLQHLPGVSAYYRRLLPLFPAAEAALRCPPADLVITFSHCVAKGLRPPPGARHLCYCFTPMRYAWLFFDEYVGRNSVKRLLSAPLFAWLRRWDRRSAARVDRFVAISRHVQARIARFYGRDSDVVYPPVHTEFWTPGDIRPAGDYDLIVSALVPYKRLDLAVRLYRRTGRRLVVVGVGGERVRLEAAAGPNIRFLGWQPDEALLEIYRNCRLLLFPGEEDFGIVPLEAMACGRPVVAFAHGGVLETVADGRTGVFFAEQTEAALEEAIARAAVVAWDRAAIRAHACTFGQAQFLAGFDTAVSKVMLKSPL